jgi:predicted XRE-type DNA-binding protein
MSRKAQPKGTHNVLADLGFEDATELSTKTILAAKLNELIDARGLSQTEAAELLGMPQPKISAIRNYKLRGISFERLLHAMIALGQHIKIVIRPSNRHQRPRISIAA